MITPVILSGGAGTRLWPLSRAARPKQLLALTGAETMLQLTAARTRDLSRFAPPIIVANGQHASEIERQLQEAGLTPGALLLEPVGRNTAPAIALAALLAPPDKPMLVMPSDHLIRDPLAFLRSVDTASLAAEQGYLVTFGIVPDRPETGYGYIRSGPSLMAGVHHVERFIEKPDLATAEALLSDGNHVWNSGIFLFRPDTYLAALDAYAPDVLAAARDAMAQSEERDARLYPASEAFAASPSISIDYAVMERAERVAVVPTEMGWSDIGSWDALHEVGSRDDKGNLIAGDVLAIDGSNCLIRSDGPAVVTVGVSDLIVIASGDAVLIVPRGQSQRLKEAVDALKASGHKALD